MFYNMTEYEGIIATELGLSHTQFWKQIGSGSGESYAYNTSVGQLFAKICSDKHANELLKGEYASLEALWKSKTLRVPNPMKVISDGNTILLVTEFLNFHHLKKFQSELGTKLAQLHLCNIRLLEDNSPEAVKKFGFSTTVCCGKISIDNNWNEDWVDFYCNQRLKPQVEMVLKNHGSAELGRLWSQLEPRISSFFVGVRILPSLLHGDLWSGNSGETEEEPVVFDPASFYGHHEFDLAITRMFGGFSSQFYQSYHAVIPPEPGFDKRKPLYELFHYLNHWNHFGGGYEGQTLSVMRKLINACK